METTVKDLKQLDCSKHLNEKLIAICLDSNCDRTTPYCCVKCLFEHYPVCRNEFLVSFDSLQKTVEIAPSIGDYNAKILSIVKEHQNDILPKFQRLQTICEKTETQGTESFLEHLTEQDIMLLKNCFEKEWKADSKQMIFMESPYFLNELRDAYEDFKARINYLFEGNFVNEARDIAEKKKLKHLSNEGPVIKKQELEVLKFFMATKTELYKYCGNAKMDILDTERLLIKYEANSEFTFALTHPYQKINLRLKYSLFPKREVMIVYVVPKDYLGFYTLREPPKNMCEHLSYIKFESINLTSTKLLIERGLSLQFDQSKKKLALYIQEKEVSSEQLNNIKADAEYVLVINVKNKEPNNLYFYIQ